MARDVLTSLRAQQRRLDHHLRTLDHEAWRHASGCAGWTVADVVLHLAQTEEAVRAVLAGEPSPLAVPDGAATDALAAAWVAEERGAPPGEILDRWREASAGALAALSDADPDTAVPWAVAELRPRTLATTRLAEHWIHELDVTVPLGVRLPDTDDLWHVARLAHRTLPYAFARAGRPAPPDVRLELTAPSGATWRFGDDQAATTVTGPAGELCRVAGRRLDPADAAALEVAGPRAGEVLELIRTYA